jgi:hypothetical protein
VTDLGLELSRSEPAQDGSVTIRLLVVNRGYDQVRVDRRLLWGPHPAAGDPVLLTAEPSTDNHSDETVLLNPDGIFGRQRRFRYDAGTAITFHGYLLTRETDILLPAGPEDRNSLAAEAEPLSVTFG